MSNSVRPHRRQPTRLPHPWDSPGNNTGVGCHFLLQCRKVKSETEVSQSYPTLSDPMDCSPPGSSIHGIFQAKLLEWGAIAFSGRDLQSFPFCCFPLFLCLDLWGRLSYLCLLFFGTLQSNGYIFPFLLCLSLLFFSLLFVRPPQTTILPFCISFFGDGLITASCTMFTASCIMSGTSVHSSSGTLSDLIPWIYLSLPLCNCKEFDLGHTWMVSGFPYFFQCKSEFYNKEFMIWATVSFWSCFCWLYRVSPFSAAKNIISLISVLTIWWCPCVESSLVLLEEGLCYDQCVLLAKLC